MSAGRPGILVLADDLSGAAEVAATLHGPVPIMLAGASDSTAGSNVHGNAFEVADSLTGSIAVDLDCRYLDPADAQSRTASALAAYGRLGERAVLIKVDSLLRGNVRASLAAALDLATGPVIFAPALPQHDRTVIAGRPHDRGVPLRSTRTWSLEDGDAPVALQDLCPLPAKHVDLDLLRTSATGALAEPLASERLITVDAESVDDIDRIVALAEASAAVLVGASALARYWAADNSPSTTAVSTATAEHTDAHDDPPTRVLTLLGTAADRIDTQVAHLLAHSETEVLDLPAAEVASWMADRALLESTARRLRSRLEDSDLVIRLCDTGETIDPRPLPGLLAELVSTALADFGPVGLAAAGGETARAVLDRLGVRSLEAVREIHPGAVLSTIGATSASASPRIELNALVTRPGGQGDSDSLTHIHAALAAADPKKLPPASPRSPSRTLKESQ